MIKFTLEKQNFPLKNDLKNTAQMLLRNAKKNAHYTRL